MDSSLTPSRSAKCGAAARSAMKRGLPICALIREMSKPSRIEVELISDLQILNNERFIWRKLVVLTSFEPGPWNEPGSCTGLRSRRHSCTIGPGGVAMTGGGFHSPKTLRKRFSDRLLQRE